MKKIWSEPVFLKNMNDYLIFWSYFIMLRFFSRMGYWDEIYENTLSCIECLRSSVGICPLLYLTLPYCINSETAPPLFVDRPQTCPSGSVTTWEGQPWKCTRSTCPRPSMAWHSLKLPSKSLSRCLSPSFFFLSLSLHLKTEVAAIWSLWRWPFVEVRCINPLLELHCCRIHFKKRHT